MSLRVLVIEDDASLRDILLDTLNDEGYQAMGAASSKEALMLAEKAALDLVVTDVRLPGLDGIEIIEQLKPRLPHVRYVVMTGYASRDAPVRAMKVGIEDYLQKPFGLDLFLEVVARAINAGQERTRHGQLFKKILEAPKKFIQRANEAALARVTDQRETVFINFYVGLRSGLIGEGSALEIYNKLEELDVGYRILMRDGNLARAELKELYEGYLFLEDYISALATSSNLEPSVRQHPNQVSLNEFRELGKRVSEARITPEQLMYAPFLRTAPEHTLETHPELRSLRTLVWG